LEANILITKWALFMLQSARQKASIDLSWKTSGLDRHTNLKLLLLADSHGMHLGKEQSIHI
jgi:hypothetical protein